jgi:hypothetical protein
MDIIEAGNREIERPSSTARRKPNRLDALEHLALIAYRHNKKAATAVLPVNNQASHDQGDLGDSKGRR